MTTFVEQTINKPITLISYIIKNDKLYSSIMKEIQMTMELRCDKWNLY